MRSLLPLLSIMLVAPAFAGSIRRPPPPPPQEIEVLNEGEVIDGGHEKELPRDCFEALKDGTNVTLLGPDCFESLSDPGLEDQIIPPDRRLQYISGGGTTYGVTGSAFRVLLTDRRGVAVATISSDRGYIADVGLVDLTGDGYRFLVVSTDDVAAATDPSMSGAYYVDFVE